MYKYVDDTTIFEMCNDDELSTIQESINTMVTWADSNDMRLNVDKCKEMIIDFSINHRHTVNAQSAKILGATISSDLSWSTHVDNIISKASKRLYMLYQLKRTGISQRDMVNIYISIVRPVLEYARPVWSTSIPQYLSDYRDGAKTSIEGNLPRPRWYFTVTCNS